MIGSPYRNVLPGRGVRIAALVAVALALAALPTHAAVSYDVSVGLPIGDDAKLFLNVTNEYYAPPQEIAMAVVRRCPRPEDDYPTVLFLARQSGRPPAEILDLRLRGESWADIMFGLRVQPSVLFVGVDRDPGPPYGRAWGYWRKHPRGRMVIDDREFVEYAKLQVAAGYYRVRPAAIITERRRGVTVERYVSNRHRGNGRGGEKGGRRERDDEREHGQGRGHKDHGDRDHDDRDHRDRDHGD